MKLRTVIDVKSFPRETGEQEIWQVTVKEIKREWGTDFEVLGVLLHVIVPRRYDLDAKRWVPEHERKIHGAYIPASGSETFKSLAKARERARSLANVLDGRMKPEWREVNR